MAIQLTVNLLDACVLAALNKQDMYGYILTQEIKKAMDISESTLYPVLRRLQREEYLTIYDEAVMGRNRRYYRIMDKGRERLAEYIDEWDEYVKGVNSLLKGDD